MAADLQVSDAALSTAYLVGTLGASTLLPAIGRWVDEVGVRRSMTIVAFAFALSLAHMSAITNIAWLAVGFLGIRLFGQGALSLLSTVAVSNWFQEKRGLALGMTMTITAGGMAVVPLLLALGVSAWGWRAAWSAAAIVVLTGVLIVARFGLVDRPSLLGQSPDGSCKPTELLAADDHAIFSRSVVLRSESFWVVAAITAANSLIITGMVFHQTNVLGEIGYSETRAAVMFIPQALGAVGGGLVFGWLCDRKWRSYMPAAIALLLSITCFVGGNGVSQVETFIYAVLIGVCTGGCPAVNSTLLPILYGIRNIGAVTGLLHVVTVVFSSLGALAFSVGAEGFGSYRSALEAFTIGPALLAGVALFRPPAQRSTHGRGVNRPLC